MNEQVPDPHDFAGIADEKKSQQHFLDLSEWPPPGQAGRDR
jgi:hypothetical protein